MLPFTHTVFAVSVWCLSATCIIIQHNRVKVKGFFKFFLIFFIYDNITQNHNNTANKLPCFSVFSSYFLSFLSEIIFSNSSFVKINFLLQKLQEAFAAPSFSIISLISSSENPLMAFSIFSLLHPHT